MNKVAIVAEFLSSLQALDDKYIPQLEKLLEDPTPLPFPFTRLNPYRSELDEALKVFSLVLSTFKKLEELAKPLI